ncbi:MAG: YdcH family protein [Sphingomonadaceae bacterium]
MSNTPHELADEFPNDQDILHKLKLENAHFVTLSDRYHEVNDEIHRIEAEVEPTSDEYAEQLKRKRLGLIDEISTMVSEARNGN